MNKEHIQPSVDAVVKEDINKGDIIDNSTQPAYSLFSQEYKESVKRDISQQDILKKWNQLSEEQRKPYIEKAQVNATKSKAIVHTVFLSLLVDLFAFTLILPLFPRLLNYYRVNGKEEIVLNYASQLLDRFKQLTSNHTGSDKWDTVLLGGLIGSLFSFLQFIVSPIIGRASDRIGRRRVLLYTMAGNILSTLIWLFAHSFNLFLIARVVAGLSEGNVQLSTAIISDVTAADQRSKNLALVGIAFAVAFTLGPPIGAWFASIDLSVLCPTLARFGIYPYSMAAFIGLALLVVETVYLYAKLPETVHNQQRTQPEIEANTVQTALLDIQRRLSTLITLKRLMGIFSFVFSGMEFTLVFLTFDVLDFSHMQQGKLLSYMGIVSAFIQGGYVRRSVQRVGEKNIVIQGMIMGVIGFYCLAVTANASHPFLWLYIGATCLAFTSGTVVSGLTALASLQCHETRDDYLSKGRALGGFRSYGQLGRALGPISVCAFYWMFGPEKCYAAGSLMMMATTWLTLLGIPNRRISSIHKKAQ
ncbi:hypothetical protein CU097_006554 [Rhizopus azygosporus]|uniref:Major facilitator superfamily (MFS) profile domain-containing protein n=1 Tax=Rhizopus azygosporus TaxID=86630 RepID=A0A367JG54_RHIAZ|nr:hypothetical protein CU097_006554 [Rhizopus azygosporus]